MSVNVKRRTYAVRTRFFTSSTLDLASSICRCSRFLPRISACTDPVGLSAFLPLVEALDGSCASLSVIARCLSRIARSSAFASATCKNVCNVRHL